MTTPRRREVVVVDDSARDIELFATACDLGGIDVDLTTFTDGRCALDALGARLAAGGAALPDTIVLDLNMPGVTGFEVLERLRAIDAYRAVRIFILSTSNSPQDRERCQRLGCDGYLVKPPGFTVFMAMLQRMLQGGTA
jgi:CheY-like chemotaxis protein